MTTVEIVFSGRGYDPATCITAGEMSKLGFEIPARVPDCAWIPKLSLIFSVHNITSQMTHDTNYIAVEFKSSKPFYWERTTFETEMTPDEIRKSVEQKERERE